MVDWSNPLELFDNENKLVLKFVDLTLISRNVVNVNNSDYTNLIMAEYGTIKYTYYANKHGDLVDQSGNYLPYSIRNKIIEKWVVITYYNNHYTTSKSTFSKLEQAHRSYESENVLGYLETTTNRYVPAAAYQVSKGT